MGRKGKVDTRRKPILQLDENKKSGAKASKKNPRKEESTAKPKYQPLYVDGGAGEVFDPQEQEKVAAEIETFLKEIVAASKQGKENLGGQTPPDEYTLPENVDTAVNSPLPSTMEVPVDMATVSFWQAVVDSKTNSSYYWNPATNEVSWTLPPNSVITNEQPVPALTGTGEPAGAPVGGTLQDYYAYYSQQIYGVDASSQVQNAAAAVTEESKDKNAQVSVVGHALTPGTEVSMPTTNGTSDTTPDSSEAGFIGPAPSNRNKGSLPNQDSPTVRGEKRQAEELSSPVGAVADSKKAKVQVEKSPAGGRQKQAGNSSTSSANEQALRFQVSAMADEFMRKLQYLHIGDEGFSPLQVMKIQVETRLEDWKDGGLPSKHLLAKLKEANKMVAEYEISAAPSGWKCVWDSATCRYFYQNTSTGESSWEYPAHCPMSPAHSELSEQPLEQAEGSNTGEPVQEDASAMQDDVIQVPVVANATPTVTTTLTPSGQELQESIVHPPPPPAGPPPMTTAVATSSQQKETTKTAKSTTNFAQSEEKALEEVRQKLLRPPRSGDLYGPEDLAAYEEPARSRVQIEASTGMEFISEFPPKQTDVRVTPGERAEKKKGKSWKKQSEDETDDFPLAPLPKESQPHEDVSGWNAPTAPPSQKAPETAMTFQRGEEPEAAALAVQEPEPLFVLRDSDIEVAQEQVADSVPRKMPELVGNEYGGVAPELPGMAADFPPNQGDSNVQRDWDQGALGNMLPTPPQEEVVVVEDQGVVYGMVEDLQGNIGGDDMLQPSDELGYAGSVEVETVEMCVATSPLEDVTYGFPQETRLAAHQQAPSHAESQVVGVDAGVPPLPPGNSLEESELILRERLLRRVMQQQQQQVTQHEGEVGGAEGEVTPPANLEDTGDMAGSVELIEYGPEVRLLQSGEDSSKYADHSQVGLQLEVTTTVPTTREHTTAGRGEKKDESTRADIEEEGEIVSTPEKRQRQETPPPKTSAGKVLASKRDLEREDSKSKSSRRVKKHRSRSRSKSKERHGRRLKKHSDASDSGEDYSRRSSKRGRKRHDDRSDSEDYHHSRRSRRHSDSDGDRLSSRKDRRHSRSVSRDSKDSHDKSQKRKKKDKKDKKKRHSHHSGSKERSGDDADKKKNATTPQNIIVGKVGSLGSIRQLGQEKKAQASTPQPEQTPPGFQSQQTPLQGDGGQQQGTAYYPQTPYMYGGYQYPYGSEQSWPGQQQGWNQQQQQGWQGSTPTTTTATSVATDLTTTPAAAGGDQAWTSGATTAAQQDWERPRLQSEEPKQHSDQAPAAAEEHVWRWDDQQHQKAADQQHQKAADQQPQPSLSCESGVGRGEQVDMPAETISAEVQVEVNTGDHHHAKPGEDQEVVVEETVIDDDSSGVIEVPTDAEITECDMEIEQMSSEAFMSEKKSRGVVSAVGKCEQELPPGAETPPATERDKTPSPLPREPPAIHNVTGPIADSAPRVVQEQPSVKPSDVQLPTGDGSVQSIDTDSPQLNGEQEPKTPSKEDAKQDQSTPGTPEAPPPTSSAIATTTPQAYSYGTYAAQAAAPAGYDYSSAPTYTQAGYEYSQAYSAYVQAAAASMAYASYSQYYANPYAAAFAGYGSPYAAYYQYANAGAFQSPGQQAAAQQSQQSDSGKKGKKEESKGMIEKWNTLQTQYGKPA